MKILIVDDDPKLRAFVSKGLETQGHTTLAAGSGLEARSVLAAQDEAPDLILLDVMMPGGDGMSFLEELRPRYGHRRATTRRSQSAQRVVARRQRPIPIESGGQRASLSASPPASYVRTEAAAGRRP